MGEIWILLNLVIVGTGIGMIAVPEKAYNWGRKEKEEPPKNWPKTSRILGVVFIVVGAASFIFEMFFL